MTRRSKSPTKTDLVNLGVMAQMVDERVLKGRGLDLSAAMEALNAQQQRELAARAPKEPVEDTRTSSEKREDRIAELKAKGRRKMSMINKAAKDDKKQQGKNGKGETPRDLQQQPQQVPNFFEAKKASHSSVGSIENVLLPEVSSNSGSPSRATMMTMNWQEKQMSSAIKNMRSTKNMLGPSPYTDELQ